MAHMMGPCKDVGVSQSIPNILGSILGSPYFGKLPCRNTCLVNGGFPGMGASKKQRPPSPFLLEAAYIPFSFSFSS